MLFDYHIHTCFSGDAESPVEAMIQAAIQKGLSEICFTDHMDYGYPGDPEFFIFSPKAYFETLLPLKEAYADKINIKIGIELGLQPHVAVQNQTLISDFSWDFVIASSHVVNQMDPYYPAYWEIKGQNDGILNYLEATLHNMDTFLDFDVYGHLDYIIRYCPEKYTGSLYRQYGDLIDECLKRIIANGKGIEVNTGGFRHGLGHPNPHGDILKRYRELGGEIITTGSDAHVPKDIALAFGKVPSLLVECGFSYVTIFSQRKPSFVKII